MLDIEYIRNVLHYDPETGTITWTSLAPSYAKPGDVAGSHMAPGSYRKIKLNGKYELAHRVAYAYMTGEVPPIIDHIDGDRTNNAWANLRPCEHAENMRNQPVRRSNSSGYKGVSFVKRTRKYQASIRVGEGSPKYLGQFSTADEAAHAYNRAAVQHHGEFACLNPIGAPKDHA